MTDNIIKILQKASRSGQPQSDIKVGGRLHDSALGAIFYVKEKEGQSKKILKTINLKNQNMWCVTIKNKRTTIRGLDDSKVLFVSESKREAKEWLETWCNLPGREDALLAKIAWLETKSGGRVIKRRVNEYLNEGLIGLILARDLKLPHIVKTRDMWIDDAEGLILQDYGGLSMQKNMVNLTLPEFKSIVIQVLVTMAVAQQQMQFKHHDVHLENVFLCDVKHEKFRGQALGDFKTWQYDLKSLSGLFSVSIDHNGQLAKLGDFGLSSVTDMKSGIRYERVDYPNLDSADMEWGEWSSRDRGLYDAVVFLSKFFMCEEMELCPDENLKWAQSLYKAMKEKWPEVECSNIGRPFRGHEGQAQIVDFLQQPIFAEFHEAKSESLKIFTCLVLPVLPLD